MTVEHLIGKKQGGYLPQIHAAVAIRFPGLLLNEREWIVKDRVRGAPDLVVEVLSPNLRIGRVEEHIEWFAEYGVRECWLVHQDHRSVTVIRFDGRCVAERRIYDRRARIESSVLPEFSACLDDILE